MADTPTPDATATDGSATTQAAATVRLWPLACPHCGGSPTATRNISGWFLDCLSDECPGRGASPTKAEAIAAWNRRATP